MHNYSEVIVDFLLNRKKKRILIFLKQKNKEKIFLPPCTSRIKVQVPEIVCFRISAVFTAGIELTDEFRLDISMLCFSNCLCIAQ